MSREAECRELINQLGELNKVKSLLLADIAVSLAQIADRLNDRRIIVTLDGRTAIRAYGEAEPFIGGRGGE